jgi:CDP-diacylglycerol--glycerol-3-phosphate 3-phosphatidyltransferase
MASNLNPANAITGSRFLTLPPFLWAVDSGRYQIAALLVCFCAVLDLFDGAVARAFDCITPFGEVFDAIADGFCYGFFLLVMVAYGWVPWLPVVLIIAMGVANLALRTLYARRAGRTVNYRSFAMERCVGFAAYLGGFGTTGYMVDYFFWTFAAIMAVTLVHDTKRMAFDPIDPPAQPVAPAATSPGGRSMAMAEESV